MTKLSEDTLKYIIARLLENANDAVHESENNKSDTFCQGRRLAYYEMLNVLKNELDANGADLEKLGLNFNVDKFV